MCPKRAWILLHSTGWVLLLHSINRVRAIANLESESETKNNIQISISTRTYTYKHIQANANMDKLCELHEQLFGLELQPPLLRLMYIAETLINPLFTDVAFLRDSEGDGSGPHGVTSPPPPPPPPVPRAICAPAHDPSEVILICWLAAQKTFLMIINVQNSCAAQKLCIYIYIFKYIYIISITIFFTITLLQLWMHLFYIFSFHFNFTLSFSSFVTSFCHFIRFL